MSTPNIPIHIFHWGTCVISFKISEKFHKDLLEHAYVSRSSGKDHRSKLAGHLKEEYTMDRKNFKPLLMLSLICIQIQLSFGTPLIL